MKKNYSNLLSLIISGVLIVVACSMCTTSEPADRITVDFDHIVQEGSPYVFGGKQPRGLSDEQWDKLAEQGFTFFASQADLTALCPCKSPEDYKANTGGCADPENWDWTNGIYGDNYAQRSIDRGMGVYMVIKNAKWNRYDEAPEDEETMPRDLDVWGDMVKKIINQYKGGLKYVACFNEIDRQDGDTFPQFYTTGSEYNRKTGYLAVVKTALQAAEASEHPGTPIGGPEAKDLGLKEIEWLLSDDSIRNHLGFISFHDFDNPDYPHDGVKKIQQLMNKFEVNIPIVRSSYTPEFERNHPERKPGTTQPEHVAPHIIGALKDGVKGTGLWEIQNKNSEEDHRYWFDGQSTVPTANFITLGSKTLGLGNGKSKIVAITGGAFSEYMAAINNDGEKVAMFINRGEVAKRIELSVKGLNKDQLTVECIYGDGRGDGSAVYKELNASVEDGTAVFEVELPAASVIGLRLL